jgi:hypothetical protein
MGNEGTVPLILDFGKREGQYFHVSTFSPPVHIPRYPMNRRLARPQASMETFEKRILRLSALEPPGNGLSHKHLSSRLLRIRSVKVTFVSVQLFLLGNSNGKELGQVFTGLS